LPALGARPPLRRARGRDREYGGGFKPDPVKGWHRPVLFFPPYIPPKRGAATPLPPLPFLAPLTLPPPPPPPNPPPPLLPLKTTPFHARTSALMQGNQWRRWAGHVVASAYELTPDREYLVIRNASALIDVSPLFKYRVSGPGARGFLSRLVTRDLRRMEV